MDIQKLITDAVAKLQGDKNLLNNFTADPVKTLESLIGVDLPDEQINAVVTGIKAKLNLDSGILGSIKGLFGGK